MNGLTIQHSILALALALFANQSQASSVSSPYFGGEMTGIYQLASSNNVPQKQLLSGMQDCADNACSQLHKSAHSQNTQKLLP
jgi:hypothetical protein